MKEIQTTFKFLLPGMVPIIFSFSEEYLEKGHPLIDHRPPLKNMARIICPLGNGEKILKLLQRVLLCYHETYIRVIKCENLFEVLQKYRSQILKKLKSYLFS